MAKKTKNSPGEENNGMEPFGTHGPGTRRPLTSHPNYKEDPTVEKYHRKGDFQTIIIPPQKTNPKKK